MTETPFKTPLSLLALILLLSIPPSLTFTPRLEFLSPPAQLARRNTNESPLRAQSGDFGSFGSQEDEEEDSDNFESEGLASGSASWTIYNDFPLFLTQCSIQSFLFLLNSMRDPQTVEWMENFTQPAIHLADKPNTHGLPAGMAEKSQLLSYHGLHAMNTTRFPTWESYFSQLLEQPQELYIIESSYKQFPDYELEINPVRLCTRLLSVRQQVGREFVKDLQVISETTNQTLNSFRDALKSTKDGEKVTIERANLMFLELGAVSADVAPSPLRKGNFDLLTLLTTQEAIHRVLNDPQRQSGVDAAGNKFLKDFYLARMVSHFSGSQRYRRADHFFEELLATSPNLQVIKGETALVNPAGIAEVIIRAREKVALEWKDLAERVPEEHLEIQRLTLNQMLSGGTGTSFEDALRGNSNIVPEAKKEVKEPEMEVVAVGDKKKEAEKGPFDVLKLPPMSVLWTEEGVNLNAPGVFE